MHYTMDLYQTNHRGIVFSHLDWVKDKSEINNENYVVVNWMTVTDAKSELDAMEKMFRRFNSNHGYHHRSMSVSDVVAISDGKTTNYYYCDWIGFEKIEGFEK